MNTHDIELPPLPEPHTIQRVWEGSPYHAILNDTKFYTEQQVREAQQAAIEADRKRRGEPVSTHNVHRGAESLPCYCPGELDHPIGKETQPAEPVKVPSDADAKHVQDFINCDGMGAVIVEGSQYRAVVRALLSRYSHLTAPTHKSSNQNQLKG